MLSKARTITGATVVIGDPKTGLPAPYGGNESIDCVSAYADGDRTGPFFPSIKILKGDDLTIVTPPRKIGRVNLVRIRTKDGTEGEVYWCELRASASHK